jgi:phosphoglycolate phosphatase-like HAD superfamily hydrolase
MITTVKQPEHDVRDIEYFFLDIDDTIIPWVAIQAIALRAMVSCLIFETKIPKDTIMQELRQVFGRAGTLDYDRVFQELDCLKNLNRRLNRKLGIDAAYESMQDITHRSRTRHNLIRERQNTKLFPHLKRLLKKMRARSENIFAVTDAPLFQAKRRLERQFQPQDLKRLFKVIFGQPDAEAKVSTRYQILEALKPNINLAELLGVDPQLIRERGVVIGNSFKSDVGLAAHNQCLAIQTKWNTATPFQLEIIDSFSSDELKTHHGLPTVDERTGIIQHTAGFLIVQTPPEIERKLKLAA